MTARVMGALFLISMVCSAILSEAKDHVDERKY